MKAEQQLTAIQLLRCNHLTTLLGVTTGPMDDVSKTSKVSKSSSTTTASATRTVLDNLNFESGVAGDFTLNILQHLVVKKDAPIYTIGTRTDISYMRKSQMKGNLPEDLCSKFATLIWMKNSLP
jgi:hypothetical protein